MARYARCRQAVSSSQKSLLPTAHSPLDMNHYLWEMRPYFRQVAGQLVLGSLAGIVMNTAVVLPAMLLAHAMGRRVGRRTTAAREANADLTASLQEQLAGVRLLRLFGRAAAAVARTAILSRRQADANLAAARLKGTLQPVYSSLMTV